VQGGNLLSEVILVFHFVVEFHVGISVAESGHISHYSYAKPILDSIRNYEYPELTISCDDHPPFTARWGFVFNLPCYALGLRIAPHADGTDGMLEVCTFKEGSLSRYMAEMIVDEMKKGKTIKEISEELSFDIDEVSYIAEFARERAAEAKQVRGQWGNERASDKEDRLIAKLSKKDTGTAQNAKPEQRKRDKYDALAAKHGLEDSARPRVH